MTLLANGNVLYHWAANFNGKDSFTYTVKDASGAVSNTATVQTFTSKRSNDARSSPQRIELATLSVSNFTPVDMPNATYTIIAGINDLGHLVGQQGLPSGQYSGWEYDGATFSSIRCSGDKQYQHQFDQ